MAWHVSEDQLRDYVSRLREQLEDKRAAGQPINRQSLEARVLAEAERELAEVEKSNQAIKESRERTRKRAESNPDPADGRVELANLAKIEQDNPLPTQEDYARERERMRQHAMQVLGEVFLAGRASSGDTVVPATAPPTPPEVIRAAPVLKANPPGPLPGPFNTKLVPATHEVPAAATGTLVLGTGLALIAAWPVLKSWAYNKVWLGKEGPTTPGTDNPTGLLSLALFIGFLVLISSLSQEVAQVTLWVVVALWVVLLVERPQIVQSVADYLSQGATTIQAQGSPQTVQRGKNVYS